MSHMSNKKAQVKPFNNRRMVLEEILKELKNEQKQTKDYIWRGTAIYSSMYKMHQQKSEMLHQLFCLVSSINSLNILYIEEYIPVPRHI